MNKDELQTILTAHKEWLNDPQTGERADLRSADLRGADLRGADPSEAIITLGNREITL